MLKILFLCLILVFLISVLAVVVRKADKVVRLRTGFWFVEDGVCCSALTEMCFFIGSPQLRGGQPEWK
jgi:hypothetical protein